MKASNLFKMLSDTSIAAYLISTHKEYSYGSKEHLSLHQNLLELLYI